jgi:hypothetical protein
MNHFCSAACSASKILVGRGELTVKIDPELIGRARGESKFGGSQLPDFANVTNNKKQSISLGSRRKVGLAGTRTRNQRLKRA